MHTLSSQQQYQKAEGSQSSEEFTQCFHLRGWMLQPYYFINSNRSQHPSHSSPCSLVTALDHTHEDLTDSVLDQHCDFNYCWLFLSQPTMKISLWDSGLDLLINRNWSKPQQWNTVLCNAKWHHTPEGLLWVFQTALKHIKQIHLNLYVACQISQFLRDVPRDPNCWDMVQCAFPAHQLQKLECLSRSVGSLCWEGHWTEAALDSFSNDDNFRTASLSTTSRLHYLHTLMTSSYFLGKPWG